MFRSYDHLQVEIAAFRDDSKQLTCMFLYRSNSSFVLKLVVCILLRVLGQVQGFRLTQHCFEYFIQ
jgi:hypothetical protein